MKSYSILKEDYRAHKVSQDKAVLDFNHIFSKGSSGQDYEVVLRVCKEIVLALPTYKNVKLSGSRACRSGPRCRPQKGYDWDSNLKKGLEMGEYHAIIDERSASEAKNSLPLTSKLYEQNTKKHDLK